MDANIKVRRAGNVAVAVLHGEYDLGNAAVLNAELVDILRCRPAGIVIDVAEVDFCDLACLRSMANLGRRAAAVGIWVRIAGPKPMLRRLLEITGLAASLPSYPDVELALRGSRHRARVPAGRSVGDRTGTGRTVTESSTADARTSGITPVHAAATRTEV